MADYNIEYHALKTTKRTKIPRCAVLEYHKQTAMIIVLSTEIISLSCKILVEKTMHSEDKKGIIKTTEKI